MNPKISLLVFSFLVFILLRESEFVVFGASTNLTSSTNVTIGVNTTDDELNTDGDCSLREAIRAANLNHAVDQCPAGSSNSTDTISLPSGTYKLNIVGSDDDAQKGDLDLTGNVILHGVSNTKTIIDADNIGERVFDIQSNAQVFLSDMTIQGGDDSGYCGGGIRNNGSLSLEKVLFIANYSSACGGGLYNLVNANANLNLVSFGNNNAGGTGGSIYNDGNLTINNSALTFGKATYGGELFNASHATLTNVIIASATADGNGGGIYSSGEITITNTTINNNQAFNGGGIYSSGEITITNTTINNNQAINIGSGGNGGGIYQGSKMNLTNVTISGNLSSNKGGGIYVYSYYDANLLNVTVTGNSTYINNGGEIYRDTSNDRNGKIIVKNVLVGNAFPGNNCAGSPLTPLGHNLDAGHSCGFDKHDLNPQILPLANNGGATQTHALQPTSPAINAGDNSGCPATDQRGYLRVGGCDIGAFEYVKRIALPIILRNY